MLDVCPECGRPLRNGIDSKQYIEYPEDKLLAFTAGDISLTQLNEFAIIYYDRTRLCANPTCINFAGDPNNPTEIINHIYQRNGVEVTEPENRIKIDFANPRVVVGVIKIKDE